MKVLFMVHVGGLLGHLARAITIARELVRRNCIVECVGHKRAEEFWIAAGLRGAFHSVSWDWSHNKVIPPRSALSWEQSCFCKVYTISGKSWSVPQPDFIVGMPGFTSAQLARLYGIPHSSVIHGPHLAPLIRLENPTR